MDFVSQMENGRYRGELGHEHWQMVVQTRWHGHEIGWNSEYHQRGWFISNEFLKSFSPLSLPLYLINNCCRLFMLERQYEWSRIRSEKVKTRFGLFHVSYILILFRFSFSLIDIFYIFGTQIFFYFSEKGDTSKANLVQSRLDLISLASYPERAKQIFVKVINSHFFIYFAQFSSIHLFVCVVYKPKPLVSVPKPR